MKPKHLMNSIAIIWLFFFIEKRRKEKKREKYSANNTLRMRP